MTAADLRPGQRIAIAGQAATVTDKPMSLLCGIRVQIVTDRGSLLIDPAMPVEVLS